MTILALENVVKEEKEAVITTSEIVAEVSSKELYAEPLGWGTVRKPFITSNI